MSSGVTAAPTDDQVVDAVQTGVQVAGVQGLAELDDGLLRRSRRIQNLPFSKMRTHKYLDRRDQEGGLLLDVRHAQSRFR